MKKTVLREDILCCQNETANQSSRELRGAGLESLLVEAPPQSWYYLHGALTSMGGE